MGVSWSFALWHRGGDSHSVRSLNIKHIVVSSHAVAAIEDWCAEKHACTIMLKDKNTLSIATATMIPGPNGLLVARSWARSKEAIIKPRSQVFVCHSVCSTKSEETRLLPKLLPRTEAQPHKSGTRKSSWSVFCACMIRAGQWSSGDVGRGRMGRRQLRSP